MSTIEFPPGTTMQEAAKMIAANIFDAYLDRLSRDVDAVYARHGAETAMAFVSEAIEALSHLDVGFKVSEDAAR